MIKTTMKRFFSLGEQVGTLLTNMQKKGKLAIDGFVGKVSLQRMVFNLFLPLITLKTKITILERGWMGLLHRFWSRILNYTKCLKWLSLSQLILKFKLSCIIRYQVI